jgi:DNA-binding MarR family transcriptional regulator
VTRLDESVFHFMRQALQEHGSRWQAAEPGLTKPQFAVLLAVAEGIDVDQVAVGARAAIDKATLADMLLRLEQRGLITRSVGADRRRRLLRLTDVGRRALVSATPIVDSLNESMLKALDEDERRQLRDLLGKLVTGPGEG